ncbi:phosphate ABC transporter substrate-binding protein [Sorangium cellulosum]|uniref:Phosphate-binding protein n=1 Tax=Sorangium cellulosum TaxID=56 RepID=A0A2L0ERN7_SORCE|nr:phosphate ABC transporter substrate-binding protein PstS [Sorangium cellulosum]AUX41963.1 phosphate ABC transporter substrate-binding protein [Sorangium cellulosum]
MARILLTLAMFLLAAACGRSDAPQETGSLPGSGKSSSPQSTADGEVALTGAGATFPYPLYTKWISEFQKANPKVKINYQSIGSGGGIRQITERTVDFGASDAPMTEEQLAKAAGILHLPTCLGAVVLTYNLEGVQSGLKLTPEAAANIFLGKIKKWNDPALQKENPDVKLPDKDIATVHRSDGSGTTKIFVDYLSAVSPEWKSGPGTGTSVSWPGGLGAKGNDGVSALISSTPASIGYIELAYAMQNKLTFASLKNQSGKFVAPSLDSTTAAGSGAAAKMPDDLRISLVNAEGEDAYPIAGFTYILAYQEQKDAAKGKVLASFLKWAVQDGQKFTNDLHYAPLPAAVVEKVNKKLASLAGPDGKPLLAP